MECQACGEGVSSKPIDRHENYKLYHCQVCDLMFWYPMEGTDPEWYEVPLDLTPFRPVQLAYWGQSQFLKDMPAQGGRLLDIRCGMGDFLFCAQKADYSVTGIDFSPKFIDIARQRFGFEELYSLTLDEFVAEKPQNRYDVITFFDVLEHLDDISGFLQSVKGLLNPWGHVACRVPNRERWRFQSPSEEWDYPPKHFTRWNCDALTALFDNHGFSISAIKTQPLVSLDRGWFSLVSSRLGIYQLSLVLAKRLRVRSIDETGITQRSMFSMISGIMIKMGVRFYIKALLPFLGLVTLPLWLLLRRQGSEIYLLARLVSNEKDLSLVDTR